MRQWSTHYLTWAVSLSLAVWGTVFSYGQTTWTSFPREIFSYTFTYFGLTVAHGSLTLTDSLSEEGRAVKLINARATSVSPTSFLFKIDNQYQTSIDANTGYPMSYMKNIDQSNFIEKTSISFDQEQGRIHFNHNDSLFLSTPTHNLFSALYFLMNHTYRAREVIHLPVFAAGHLWEVEAESVRMDKIITSAGVYSTVCVEIEVLPSTSLPHQGLRTDVLTHRLIKEGKKTYVWISTDQEGAMVKGTYELFPTELQMILTDHRQEGN